MPESPDPLSPSEWKLLRRGMNIYLDLLLDDLCTVLSGEALKDTLVLGDETGSVSTVCAGIRTGQQSDLDGEERH